MTPEDLVAANLVENPFRTTPPDRVTVWAGHHGLRKAVENTVVSVRSDNVGISEFAVLHGQLGTGKSHVLRYFKTVIEDAASGYDAKCVYLRTLRVADKVTFLTVYREIVRLVGRAEIESLATALVAKVDADVATLENDASPEDYRQAHNDGHGIGDAWRMKAVDVILGDHSSKYPLFEDLAEGKTEAWQYLCAGRLSAAAQKKLRVTDQITSDFDALTILGLLVNLGCCVPLKGRQPFWKAFYVFVDEVETMADLEPKAMMALNQSFRDFIDMCPEHLCVFFGMTADAALVEALFSQALLSRMTRDPIQIPGLDNRQAASFLKEVLLNYRVDRKASGEWHPFVKDSLEYIVDETPDKTPRRLFTNCRRVIERAAKAGLLKKKGGKIKKKNAEDFLL